MALVFRKSEWGHRFLDVHEFPECGNRLLLCRFRRGKEQTAGILYVWVVYSPTLTTTSTKMAKGGRKPPTEPMVAALVKRIREEIRGHVASSREQQMHSLEVILTDGNSVVDPAKDRYTYPVGKCRITTGGDKDRQGRVMAVHAMKEKITVQMDYHTAEQSYKVSRRQVQCLHEQTGVPIGEHKGCPSDAKVRGRPNEGAFAWGISQLNHRGKEGGEVRIVDVLRHMHAGRFSTHRDQISGKSESRIDQIWVMEIQMAGKQRGNTIKRLKWKTKGAQRRHCNSYPEVAVRDMMGSDHVCLMWRVDSEVLKAGAFTEQERAKQGEASALYREVTISMNKVKWKPVPKSQFGESCVEAWHTILDDDVESMAKAKQLTKRMDKCKCQGEDGVVAARELLEEAVGWGDQRMHASTWAAYKKVHPDSKVKERYPDGDEDPGEKRKEGEDEKKGKSQDSKEGQLGRLARTRQLWQLLTMVPAGGGGEDQEEEEPWRPNTGGMGATIGDEVGERSLQELVGKGWPATTGPQSRSDMQRRLAEVWEMVRYREGGRGMLTAELGMQNAQADRNTRRRRGHGKGKLPPVPRLEQLQHWWRRGNKKAWEDWMRLAVAEISGRLQVMRQASAKKQERGRVVRARERETSFREGRTKDWIQNMGLSGEIKSETMTVAFAPVQEVGVGRAQTAGVAGTEGEEPQEPASAVPRIGQRSMHGAEDGDDGELEQVEAGKGARTVTHVRVHEAKRWQEGDAVMVNVHNNGEWYQGKVQSVQGGKLEVQLEGGDTVMDVGEERVRPPGEKTGISTDFGHIALHVQE